MNRLPFSGTFPTATCPLEWVHMDLCGPITPASRGGNLYFLKIIDGFSKYRFIFPVWSKSDTFQAFSGFLSQAETFHGTYLVSVVSDNSGEFINKQFLDLFLKKGIRHTPLAPYTPQQNPFAEQGNCTTVEKAHALLATAGIPLDWWGEAVTTSVFLENQTPDSSFVTPYERWHGKFPDLT